MSLTKKATARTHTEVLPMGFIQGLAEYSRSQYFITIPSKFTIDDVFDPSFWRHANMLRPNDRLELVAEDGSWDLDARVVNASAGFAVLRLLRVWKAPTEALQGDVGEPTVAFVPQSGWVLFGADGNPVARFADETSARAALQDHIAASGFAALSPDLIEAQAAPEPVPAPEPVLEAAQ